MVPVGVLYSSLSSGPEHPGSAMSARPSPSSSWPLEHAGSALPGGRVCPPGRFTDTPDLDVSRSPPLAIPVPAATTAPRTPRASIRSSFLPILLFPVLRAARRGERHGTAPPIRPAQSHDYASCSGGRLQRHARRGNGISARSRPRVVVNEPLAYESACCRPLLKRYAPPPNAPRLRQAKETPR